MRQLSLSLRVLAEPHVFSPLQPRHSYGICFRCLEVGACVGGSRGFLSPQERRPALLIPLHPLCPTTFLHVRGVRAAPAGDAIPTHLMVQDEPTGFYLAKHCEVCPALAPARACWVSQKNSLLILTIDRKPKLQLEGERKVPITYLPAHAYCWG